MHAVTWRHPQRVVARAGREVVAVDPSTGRVLSRTHAAPLTTTVACQVYRLRDVWLTGLGTGLVQANDLGGGSGR